MMNGHNTGYMPFELLNAMKLIPLNIQHTLSMQPMIIMDIVWLILMDDKSALPLQLIDAYLNLSLSLHVDGGPVKRQCYKH
jgi:hypothetical protein